MKEYKKSSHHVIPSSRSKFGREVLLPEKFHKSWHHIFGNLYGHEIELFVEEINELMDEVEEITNRDIAKIREKIKGMNIYEYQKKAKDRMYKRRR